MNLSELIKHPVCEIPVEVQQELVRKAKEAVKPYSYYSDSISYYDASIHDGVLEIDMYESGKNRLNLKYRHFYSSSENRYATWKADGSKGDGTLEYYRRYRCFPISPDTDNEIMHYFGMCPIGEKNPFGYLCNEENKILYIKRQARYKKMTDVIDKRMALVPEKLPEGFEEWINEWVFEKDRYFFYNYNKNSRKMQIGYCSHCRTTFEAEKVKHGAEIECPNCTSKLKCKALGKTTQYSIRSSATVMCVQEIHDSSNPCLVERFFDVSQIISKHHQGALNVNKNINIHEVHRIFLDTQLKRYHDSSASAQYHYGEFLQSGRMRWCSEKQGAGNWYYQPWTYPGNIDTILSSYGGDLRNVEISALAPHIKYDFEKLYSLLRSFPAVENLAKQGLYNLVRAVGDLKGNGYSRLSDCINRSKISAAGFLCVDKLTLKKMSDINITEDEYILYKRASEMTGRMTWELFDRMISLELASCTHTLCNVLNRRLMGRVTTERFIGYLEKQVSLSKRDGPHILSQYLDYYSMASNLNIDMTNESALFPRDIIKEHDVVLKLTNDKKYQNQDKKLSKRVKILEMLSWQDKKYLIRPLRDANEFIKESTVLSHCVKTYIDRCAAGKTNIYVIRKLEQPETPYYTLTLTNEGRITANLGKNNCMATPEVKSFADKWLKQVVSKHLNEFIEAVDPNVKKSKNQQKIRIGA